MKTVAIIQARMGSTRLPNKVLADIAGQPMLYYVVTRTQQANTLDLVVVATSDKPADDSVARFCKINDIPCFRGNEDDVLDRYYQAAQSFQADVVVRITADCPLIDPDVIDEVVRVYLDGDYDYVSNVLPPTYPDGVDVEVFSFVALADAWHKARWQSEREHVTAYIHNHAELFQIGNLTYKNDLSNLRWTVDELQDLEFVRAVYNYFGDTLFRMSDVLTLLKDKPKLMTINMGIQRDEGYEKSLREDHLID